MSTEAGETAAPADVDSDIAATVQMSRRAPTRLSTADIKAILELSGHGYKQVDIAKIVECSQASVSNVLRDFTKSPEVMRQLAAGLAVEALNDWREAKHIAAQRGDHRPAKELMEMAYPELRPAQGSSAGGGGITINVGMPGKPLDLPVIQLSPLAQRVTSETDSNH